MRGEAPDRRSRRWWPLGLSVTLLCAALSTAASAQGPGEDPIEPGPECKEATGQETGCDTELTPVAKDADPQVWTAFGGAEFGDPEGDLIEGSQTPNTVDFYTVRFKTPELGFAGGAACPEDTPFDQLHDDFCGPSPEDGTPRVPVIYRYLDPDGAAGELPGSWEEIYRGTTKGYVGSIAFLSPAGEEAIAVGGTGNYPRRELGRCEAGETPQTDPEYCHGDELPTGETDEHYAARDLAGTEPNAAGAARVWLHRNRWSEQTELPTTAQDDPMRGLSAVDCSPRLQDGRRCLAGGYRQLWLWQGSEFTKAYTDKSPATEVDYPDRFRFRVRAIRFAPGANTPPSPGEQAFVVTAGCCAENKGRNQPWGLSFLGDRLVTGAQEVTRPGPANCSNSLPLPPISPCPIEDVPQKVRVPEETETGRKLLADSYYSICMTCVTQWDSLVRSPGGPAPKPPAPGLPPPPEPPSRIIRHSSAAGGAAVADVYDLGGGGAKLPALPGALRLVAGDGDFTGPQVATAVIPFAQLPDRVMDWAVGELTSSGQGIAHTTLEGPTPVLDSLDCPSGVGNTFATDGSQVTAASECGPTPDNLAPGTKSKRWLRFPTYALNAFAFTPATDSAWAAGDMGALLRLGGKGGAGGAGDEPLPPRLGARQLDELGDGSAYDGLDSGGSGPAGEVPPLAANGERRLDQPRLLPGGVPDPTRKGVREDVDEIVMSRDGAEGWALGAEQGPATTLYHYAGGRWTRCETGLPQSEVQGVVAPDPACEALAPLRNANGGPLPILAAARIPLERDADPSNDDEFEVMAIGGKSLSRLVLRYRNGRWSTDDAATKTLTSGSAYIEGLACTAPDDCWLVTSWQYANLHHFDGTSWTDCWVSRQGCGDPGQLLPFPPSGQAGTEVMVGSAGGRVYLAGTRFPSAQPFVGTATGYPMILFKDREGAWSNDPSGGGFDPGCAPNPAGTGCIDSGENAAQGRITALSVAPDLGGGDVGWATGVFGGLGVAGNRPADAGGETGRKLLGGDPLLLRLEPRPEGGGAWSPWGADGREPGDRLRDPGDASADYLPSPQQRELLTIPGAVGEGEAWMVPKGSDFLDSPMLEFREGRWQAAATPFSLVASASGSTAQATRAVPQAAAPDGRGGFWLAVRQAGTAIGAYQEEIAFYRYTDRAPKPVFTEAPHPVREEITAAAGGPDGSLWVATASSAIYRYDRVTGWNRVRVPGWDPGRTVTRPSRATAIAIGPGGDGLVVGEGGRIAELTSAGTRLDEAAGAALCQLGGSGPCGTGRTLRAAAIAPSGAALVGGDGRALLWRAPDGEFQAIAPPPTAPSATITSIAYPQDGQAFLTTDLGQVFEGNPAAGNWHVENRDPISKLLVSADASGNPQALRAIALDGNAHGYAVGEAGVVLERTGNPAQPWRRLDEGFRDDFYSVALSAGGGEGALIGGANGVIYTLSDGAFEIARPADPWDPLTTAPVTTPQTARIVGLAVLPGGGQGEAEAWAVSQVPPGRGRSPAPGAILHYASEPEDPLVDPAARVEPLPDVPASPAALEIAAFGRSECQTEGASTCAEPQDSNLANDSVVRRVSEEIAERERSSDIPVIAALTGDIALAAGADSPSNTGSIPLDTNLMHRRWVELVAARFEQEGVPLFAAIGGRDLSQVKTCTGSGGCSGTQQAGAGTSGPWSDSMRGMHAPWGEGEPLSEDGVEYRQVDGSSLGSAPLGGGARTHYALDVVKGGEKLLRLVFADNSHRSFAASEPNQNPVEQSGQEAWLDSVLCRQGEGAGCTRASGEPAVVVANTPTYSYGPGGLEHTATDAATFERALLAHGVSVLISGRLGWNGLYYTCAPQLHTPAPGGEHPTAAPSDLADCVSQQDDSGLPAEPPDPTELLGEIGVNGILPGVIAASAGGAFGPDRDEQGSAADGYWHGYSVIRIPADGDPAGVVVEQRPVLDWISIRPAPGERTTHMVRAGKKLALEGFGREVAGTDAALRYDEITTPAITHRYDLLAANPDRPWLPKGGETADNCDPYDCLPSNVGTIHTQSGEVRAGNGQYPRTYAVAALSVADQSATYPLVFEPRASYRAPAQAPAPPVAIAPPPPPPAPAQPTTPQVNLPAAPVLPVLSAGAIAPPPVPPAPPTFASQAPLDTNISPTALSAMPPTAVTQPPTPPVNPAPPGGARKEARQRQAAAQKSGADSDASEGAEETQGSGGDLARGPESPDQAATRYENAATRVERDSQPSAWTRDVLLGGGLGVAALLLAIGANIARPTPRRRQPELPAPAFSRVDGRGRRR